MKAGVLALQGDFREHARVFAEAGATPVEVRLPADLDAVDCLAIPGGESTTIGKLASAYGRQVESFEADLDVRGIDHRVRGVFIRAPWIERIGDGVEVLAEFEDRPVVLEQGNLLATSFH